MTNTISWNIKSVRTQSAFERLKTIKNQYNSTFICLEEPFVQAEKLTSYMRMLDLQGCYANNNNKIWIMWSNEYTVFIISDTEKQVTCKINHPSTDMDFHITCVYAKCRTALRKTLWEDLASFANSTTGSWSIMGDFNVIVDAEEKEGGKPYRIDKRFDFINCIEDCGVQDVGFVGNTHTWYNNRDAPDTIWKRLDRVLYNSEWFDLFNKTYVTHLARTCSDHTPLLVQFSNCEDEFSRYFKFLNTWTDHPQFHDVVKKVWEEECHGNPMWILHQKLKRTATKLRSWSKETYGDIYGEPKRMEEDVIKLEHQLVHNNNPESKASLNKATAEYVLFLKTQEAILK